MLKQLNFEDGLPRSLEAAAVYNVIAACHISVEKMDEAEKNLNTALDIEREHKLRDHVFLCETLKQLGVVYERRGDWTKSLDYYNKTLEMAQRLARPNNASDMARIAAVYNNMGIIYDFIYRYEPAKRYYRLACRSYDEAFKVGTDKDYHHAKGEVLNNLACIYDIEGDYETSQKLNQEILNIYKDTLGDRHLNVGKVYVNRGSTLYCLGKFKDALGQYDIALNIYTSLPVYPNQSIATVWSNSGESYRALGETAHAIKHIAKGFHLRLSVHKDASEKNLDVAMSHKILADFYMNEGELRLAYTYARCALKTFLSSVGSEQHPDIGCIHNILGEIARRRDDVSGSIRLHQTAFTIFFRTLPPKHVMVADYFYLAARTYLDQRNYFRALLYCVYAKAMYKKCVPNHPNLSEILSLMARIYEAQSDFVRTKEYDRMAVQHAVACRNNINPMLLAIYYDNYGKICCRTHDFAKAFRSWAKARYLRCHLIKKRKERRTSDIDFYLNFQKLSKRRASI
jgi:tetratricopeptide (TPR) repeat protein